MTLPRLRSIFSVGHWFRRNYKRNGRIFKSIFTSYYNDVVQLVEVKMFYNHRQWKFLVKIGNAWTLVDRGELEGSHTGFIARRRFTIVNP